VSLESIRERVEAATEGPWVRYGIAGITSEEWDIAWEGHGQCNECGAEVNQVPFVESDDAEFAAHARTDIPLLLKVAEAAKKLDGFEPEDIDCEVWDADYQEAVKALRTALAELEAGE